MQRRNAVYHEGPGFAKLPHRPSPKLRIKNLKKRLRGAVENFSKKIWTSPLLKVASRSLGGMKAESAKRQRTNSYNERIPMKTHAKRVFVSVLLSLSSQAHADPQVDSWLTTYSGKYARIYATDADKT